jgi:hypothetical protein
MNIPQTPTSQHAERQYLHTLIAGAWLPLLQASIFAAVIAIGVWVIAFFVFDAMDPHKPALVFFVLTWGWMLGRLQRHWLNLTSVEQFFQADINGDGVIGEATPQATAAPAPRRVVINLAQVSDKGAYQSNVINFPGTDEQLNTFAQGLMNGMSLSEKTWTPESKLYSIPEFRNLMTVMFANGLIEYISETDKRQGRRLTDKGTATMKEIATSPLPHPDL